MSERERERGTEKNKKRKKNKKEDAREESEQTTRPQRREEHKTMNVHGREEETMRDGEQQQDSDKGTRDAQQYSCFRRAFQDRTCPGSANPGLCLWSNCDNSQSCFLGDCFACA